MLCEIRAIFTQDNFTSCWDKTMLIFLPDASWISQISIWLVGSVSVPSSEWAGESVYSAPSDSLSIPCHGISFHAFADRYSAKIKRGKFFTTPRGSLRTALCSYCSALQAPSPCPPRTTAFQLRKLPGLCLGRALQSICGAIIGIIRLLLVSQASLSFSAWCLISWKLLLHIFFYFSFISFSGGSVNLVPFTVSWPEAEY